MPRITITLSPTETSLMFLRTATHRAITAVAAFGILVESASAQSPRAAMLTPALSLSVENIVRVGDSTGSPIRSDHRLRLGDVIRYRLTLTNTTPKAIRQAVLLNRIPPRLELVAESNRVSRSDTQLDFSVDGGRTFSEHPVEEISTASGMTSRAIPSDRFTHIRWTLASWLAPGATITAQYNARLRLPAR